MDLFKLFKQLISFTKKPGTSIDTVRDVVIRLSFYLAFLLCVVFLGIRILEQNYEGLIPVIISIFLSLGFIWFSYRGYSQPLIIIANVLYLGVASYEGYLFDIPIQSVLYFSILPAITVFLIKNKTFRFIYLILNILVLIVLNYLTEAESVSNIITFILVALICYSILLLFIELMERQQQQLSRAVKKQKETLKELEAKHQDLLLFTNMMNHDLKAPLRTIKGFSQLLGRTEQTERQKEYVDFISNSATNLEALISDLLLYSKMNTVEFEFEDIDLESIIDGILSLFQYDIEQKNVQIIKENLPTYIYGKSDGLRTVFQNLISNAIKYQPKDIENHIPEIKITYQEQNDFDIICIHDNGIGIDEKYIPKLFMPFTRFESAANYEGTGLGLSICKKILDKHRGDIHILPVQKGTRFCLKFPKKNDMN